MASKRKKGGGGGNKDNSGKGNRRGLLGSAAGTGFGIYGLGSALGGLGASNDDNFGGSSGGFATSGGSVTGAGGSNYTPVGAATSILSDADSSDPVVRQLQDIEKVLVSIKGDTALLAGSAGGGGLFGRGKNNPALQAMYGNNQRSGSDLKSFLPLFAAALYGLFGRDGDGGDGGGFVDKNQDDQDDRTQNPEQVAAETALDPYVEETALKGVRVIEPVAKLGAAAADGARRTADVLKPVVVSATRVSKNVADYMKPAAAAADIPTTKAPSNVVDMNNRPFTPPPAAANDPILPDLKPTVPDAPDTPDSLKARIAKILGKSLGKYVPIVGDAMTAADMSKLFLEEDYIGALGEAKSLAYTYGSAAVGGVLGATGIGALPGAGVTLAGAGLAAEQDFRNAARALYKEIYGKKPEDDPEELREQRYNEILEIVKEYFKNLPADLMQRGPVEAQLEVEPRPEVTGTGRNLEASKRRAANWDKKYGEMYNADGMMKPEFVPAAKAEAAAQGTGFLDRAMNRYGEEIETATELGGQIKEGFDKAIPFELGADQVEFNSESAAAADQQDQANRISRGVGDSVASTQQVQSTGSVPVQPAINVSVAGAKNSFPQNNSSLMMIMRNGSYLT